MLTPIDVISGAKSQPIIAEPEIHRNQLDGVTGFLLLMSEGLISALESARGPEQANQVKPLLKLSCLTVSLPACLFVCLNTGPYFLSVRLPVCLSITIHHTAIIMALSPIWLFFVLIRTEWLSKASCTHCLLHMDPALSHRHQRGSPSDECADNNTGNYRVLFPTPPTLSPPSGLSVSLLSRLSPLPPAPPPRLTPPRPRSIHGSPDSK